LQGVVQRREGHLFHIAKVVTTLGAVVVLDLDWGRLSRFFRSTFVLDRVLLWLKLCFFGHVRGEVVVVADVAYAPGFKDVLNFSSDFFVSGGLSLVVDEEEVFKFGVGEFFWVIRTGARSV